MKLLNGQEEEGLRLYGLVFCTAVDTKHDNGLSRVSVISAINLWHRTPRRSLLESVVSLASDSARLYELLGYMISSNVFVRTLFYLTDSQECLATPVLHIPKSV